MCCRLLRSLAWLGLLAAASLVSGCIHGRSDRGVEARWHELDPSAFRSGTTTRADVLDLLGPPSQVLSFEGGSVFYYLVETTATRGVVLIVYNDTREETSYDRAIFFFDAEGVLSDYAVTGASGDG